MTCKKCQCKVHKPIEGGYVCTCCGAYTIQEIEAKPLNIQTRCYAPRQLRSTDHLDNATKRDRNMEWMKANYGTIQKLLLVPTSWNKITDMMGKRTRCVTTKCLVKYYKQMSAAV
jgi:hypothetical protein